MLVANNTDLNDPSTTSLAGTKNLSSGVHFPRIIGHYHVDLDLSVLSVSTCCAFMHFLLNPVSSMTVVKVYF